MRLICVTFRPNDCEDHTALYDWAYDEFHCLNIGKAMPVRNVPVISGVRQNVSVRRGDDFTLIYSKNDQIELSCELSKFVYAL